MVEPASPVPKPSSGTATRKYIVGASVVVALVAVLVYKMYHVLDLNLDVAAIKETVVDGKCRSLTPPGPKERFGGMEDIEFVGDGTWAIVSNLDPDMLFKFETVAKKTFPLLSLNTASETLRELPLEGYPASDAFFPHGISYHPESRTLGVVNHAWAFGGERVDFFEVQFKGDEPSSVRYVKSIHSPIMLPGALNDLTILETKPAFKFYVTTWLQAPHNVDGPAQSTQFKTLGFVLANIKGSYVISCEDDHCQSVGDGAVMHNGIYLSHDKSKLAAADAGVPGLQLYKVEGMSLKTIGFVPCPHHLDNIYPDLSESTKEKQVYYVTGFYRGVDGVQLTDSIAAGQRGTVAVPAGASKVTIMWNGESPTYTIEMVHSTLAKSNIGAWSVTARSPANGKIFIGSFTDTGMIVCDK